MVLCFRPVHTVFEILLTRPFHSGLSVELLMCLTHYVHMLILYGVFLLLFPRLPAVHPTKVQLIIMGMGIQLLLSRAGYNKEKWLNYIHEFENETPDPKTKGKLYVSLYLIGPVVGFFILEVIIIMITTPLR